MPNPNIAQGMPQGDAWLARRLEQIERDIRELRSSPSLTASTIPSDPGLGIRTGDFDGTSFADPGTIGNYFGGDGLVAGNIFLRPGTVSDDALQNPIAAQILHADATSFTITTTSLAKATATVTVPAGFTQALVMAVANISGFNGANNNADIVSVASRINGTVGAGWAASDTSVNQSQATATIGKTALLTGLTDGSTFTVATWAQTQTYTWPSTTWNTANIDGQVIFLR